MSGHYDPVLVALSIAVAILASFTALNLASRLSVADRSTRLLWLIAAGLALGGGTWSMHFVGMLAFVMPVPATYDVQLTLVSFLLPILVIGAGLLTLCRFGTTPIPLLAAGLLAGSGIVAMHYCGMAAMRMPGVKINYIPWLVAASIAIAVIAAAAALWLAFRTTGTRERFVAAAVMGLAVSGMHYTGMAAAIFTMDDRIGVSTRPAINSGILAIVVASTTSVLLLLGLITAFFDRKLSTLTATEALSLRRSEERLRALHRNGSDIIAILSRDGTFIYEASSARQILGYRTREMVGRPLLDFVQSEAVPDVQAFLNSLLAHPSTTITREICLLHADGSWCDFEIVGKNLLHVPAIGGLVINMRDISERKRLMAELERLSVTDTLTNTLNRRGFMQLAEREVERMRSSGEPLSIVMIDIDHFKGVNDVYGHAAGDAVLAMVAARCQKSIRDIDILSRFGGEEFIILLPEASLAAARTIVARLRAEISGSRISTIKGEVSVTASFGLASVDSNGLDLETAIRLADEALYEAKNSGRNCIKVRA